VAYRTHPQKEDNEMNVKEIEMDCGTIVAVDPSADGVCENCVMNVIDWIAEAASEMLGQDVPFVPAAMIRNARVDGRWVLTLQVLLPLKWEDAFDLSSALDEKEAVGFCLAVDNGETEVLVVDETLYEAESSESCQNILAEFTSEWFTDETPEEEE